jgi:hypothetical protein
MSIGNLFTHYAGGTADAYLCAKWAFGDGFESEYGDKYPSLWNKRHSDLFVMSEEDGVAESIEKIVNLWRGEQGMRKVNKNKATKAVAKPLRDDVETSFTSTESKGVLPPCEKGDYMITNAKALIGRIEKLEKADKWYNDQIGKIDKNFDVMRKADKQLDDNTVSVIKIVKLQHERLCVLDKFNKTLTKQVKQMATDIEKIKARMQVAHKKVEVVKPKVQSKIAKAHGKANAKLPKTFGKVR